MSETQLDSPYRGLAPYRETDAPFFCGRQDETRLIIANLCAAPLTLLFGASGVGKTSVLRAGVLHNLRSRSDVIGVYFNKWKGDPATNLKAAVSEAAAQVDLLKAGAIDAELPLEDYLAQHAIRFKCRLIIILDQFEEYFSYHGQREANDFASELAAAIMLPESKPENSDTAGTAGQRKITASLGFLISIRDDAVSRLDHFESDIPNLFENYLRLDPLDGEAAKAAIILPLKEYNARLDPGMPMADYEPELVEAVIEGLSVATGPALDDDTANAFFKARVNTQDDAAQETEHSAQAAQPEALKQLRIQAPYLQLVLTRLWAEATRRPPPVMRLSTLKKLGGVQQIINSYLSEVLRNLKLSERRTASRLFFFLVSPSGAKIAHTAADLAELTGISSKKVVSLLNRLSAPDIRILNSFELNSPAPTNAQQDQDTYVNYEIYHDFLAQPILAWRARQRLYQRLLVLQLFWLFPAFIAVCLILLMWLILPEKLRDPSDVRFQFILFSILLSVPLSIGVLIGRAWARAR